MSSDDASSVLTQPFTMLLIDDKLDVAKEATRTFRSRRANVLCDSVESTAKACDYLSQTGEFIHVGRPDLILFNASQPTSPDQDFLMIRKRYSNWKDIPVIAYSTSQGDTARQICLQKGADVFVERPGDFERWSGFLRALIRIYSRRRR